MRWLLCGLISIWSASGAWANAPKTFSFSLLSEPHSMSPQTSAAASGNYLFHNIYRGLFRYDAHRGLVEEDAKSCTRQSDLVMVCELNELKWSDGQELTSQHYVDAFRNLINRENRSPQADVLFSLKNARDIWKGKKAPETLGVKSIGKRRLRFDFSEYDPEFEYKLTHPALTPRPPMGYLEREKSSLMVFNGPYRITNWEKGKKIQLEANPHYLHGIKGRPPLTVLIVDEDSTALRLYESGHLQFLRRLVASEIARFRSKPGFYQIPMARFDYVGFGPELLKLDSLRKALSLSVEYKSFHQLFDTHTPPGCISLPEKFMDRKVKCIQPDFQFAKKLIKDLKDVPKLEMQFSQMGGDDIARAAEWFQGQWKKNLGIEVELKSQEQALYLRQLRADPPTIFRKGVSLDRPTCLAALEVLTKDNPENYIRFKDSHYEALVKKLIRARRSRDRNGACRQAVEYLLSTYRLIPLGQMHFTILADTRFKGWTLNELNQLDLSQLQMVPENAD